MRTAEAVNKLQSSSSVADGCRDMNGEGIRHQQDLPARSGLLEPCRCRQELLMRFVNIDFRIEGHDTFHVDGCLGGQARACAKSASAASHISHNAQVTCRTWAQQTLSTSSSLVSSCECFLFVPQTGLGVSM
jgi:hypothetical protein